MRTKTQYRDAKSEIPAVAVGQPDGSAVAVDVEHHGEPEPIAEAEALHEHQAEVEKADEAALALKKQIDALRQSEELNRRAAAQAAQLQQRPPTREEKLGYWRSQGMPEDQVEFLKENPAMIDFSELAAFAANEALQAGHERGSRGHMQAMKETFDKHLAHLQAQAQQTEPTAMQETPRFFQPPPPKPAPERAPIVSAPISRTVPGSGPRDYETDPRRVTLSVEERQIAKLSGVSETDYARGKLELQARRARGEI